MNKDLILGVAIGMLGATFLSEIDWSVLSKAVSEVLEQKKKG